MKTMRDVRSASGQSRSSNGGMEQALYRLHHDRVFAPDDGEDALHPQQIVAVGQHQRVEPVGDMLPMQRFGECETKRADLGVVTVDVVMVMMLVPGRMCSCSCVRGSAS